MIRALLKGWRPSSITPLNHCERVRTSASIPTSQQSDRRRTSTLMPPESTGFRGMEGLELQYNQAVDSPRTKLRRQAQLHVNFSADSNPPSPAYLAFFSNTNSGRQRSHPLPYRIIQKPILRKPLGDEGHPMWIVQGEGKREPLVLDRCPREKPGAFPRYLGTLANILRPLEALQLGSRTAFFKSYIHRFQEPLSDGRQLPSLWISTSITCNSPSIFQCF